MGDLSTDLSHRRVVARSRQRNASDTPGISLHAVIIADASFAARERALLARLEVGLADEGVRVTHAVPYSHLALQQGQGTDFGIQSTVVPYQQQGFALTRRRRAGDLRAAIDSATEEAVAVSVIHAFGSGCWRIAIELARQLRVPALFELWHPRLIPEAAALLESAGARSGTPVEFLVSEASVAAAMRSRAPQAKVYSAAWGVHAPARPRGAFSGDRTLGVAMLCDTGDPRAFGAALSGLIRATGGGPEFMVIACIEQGSGSRAGVLWSGARRLGVLDRFSLMSEVESRREPVLQADLLLLPEATGRQRTLTLEAMGSGVAIVAAADPFSETLVDGTTARLVSNLTPEGWAERIRTVAKEPQSSNDTLRAAHEYVRSKRTAAGHVADVLRVYQQVTRAAINA